MCIRDRRTAADHWRIRRPLAAARRALDGANQAGVRGDAADVGAVAAGSRSARSHHHGIVGDAADPVS